MAYTESLLLDLLAMKYRPPEYYFLRQFNHSVGTETRRVADAIAVGCYVSRGLDLHGFEVKTNRQDLRNEIGNPNKAESIGRYCDRWWLVASSCEVYQNLEVPLAWGIMIPGKRGLTVAREATRLEALPLSRAFLASILRRAQDLPKEAKTREYQQGYKHGLSQAAISAHKRGYEEGMARHSALKNAIASTLEGMHDLVSRVNSVRDYVEYLVDPDSISEFEGGT